MNEQHQQAKSPNGAIKQPHENYIEQSTYRSEAHPYSRLRIILWYGLLGGPIGGFFVGAFAKISEPATSMSMLAMLASGVIGGAFMGFIPALLTGCWLAARKVTIRSNQDWITIGLSGFFITMIMTLTMILIILLAGTSVQSFSRTREIILPAIGMGITGGISSLIVGALTLPRITLHYE